MTKWQRLIDGLVTRLKTNESVEGAFIGGSLATQYADDYTDIDLGIVSANSLDAFREVWNARFSFLEAVDKPMHLIERGWDNCQQVAALYPAAHFPPVGLEIDIIISQLQFVNQQMPYASYQIVFDRAGRLQARLEELRTTPDDDMLRGAILHLFDRFPFYLHDVYKALLRRDGFNAHAVAEDIRQAIFALAAIRDGRMPVGTKRLHQHLTKPEQDMLLSSYETLTLEQVRTLTDLFVTMADSLMSRYGLVRDVSRLSRTIEALTLHLS